MSFDRGKLARIRSEIVARAPHQRSVAACELSPREIASRVEDLGLKDSRPFFEKLVWTADDVTAFLQCSKRTVWNLVASDRIPYIRVRKLVRFQRHRVIEWLQKGGTR
jgi:excisionase family DNA binding protein